ncbi:MAG: hypothetical protein A0129_08380 [Limnobacter sp. CACIAM 66H1]|nr:MAG: hypothetical protein A0129_08380 [Limnobacter sp. CACIAM 66H1]
MSRIMLAQAASSRNSPALLAGALRVMNQQQGGSSGFLARKGMRLGQLKQTSSRERGWAIEAKTCSHDVRLTRE